jgi:hypothetical protein
MALPAAAMTKANFDPQVSRGAFVVGANESPSL